MNILLANLHWNEGLDLSLEKMRQLHFPLGLAIIASQIRENRKDNLFVIDNYVKDISNEQIFNYIDTYKIDCILLSAFLGNYQYRYLKKFIKNLTMLFPELKIIIGSHLASSIPELLIGNITARDEQLICVIGEGEETIIELLDCIDSGGNLSKVKGIVYKNGEITSTPSRPRITDLDKYKLPAYDIFETKKYVDYLKDLKATNHCWELIGSRGCSGGCAYCSRIFKMITRRRVSSVVKEMEDFYAAYGLDRFNFVDENFLNLEKYAWDFYHELKKSDIKFRWRFQGRADQFKPELIHSLIEVGLYDVTLGIESGSPMILNEMNKKLDLGLALKNILALSSKIDTHGSFLVGMPSESHRTIEQTCQFIRDSRLKYIRAGILTVFPRTPLYETVKNKGLIHNEDDYCEELGPVYTKPYINLTSYSDEELIKWVEIINSLGTVNDGLAHNYRTS